MKRAFKWISDIIISLVGTAIYTCGVYFFTEPNGIAPGGVVGISTALNALFGTSVGMMTFLINIPLLILGAIYLGRNFIIKTLICLMGFTAILDYGLVHFSVYTEDKLIAAIFGGVFIGVGLGIVYLSDASTGGMDIVNRLILRRVPNIKMGSIVFITDTIVILFAVFAFKDINVLLYSWITIFISTKLIDEILYGTNERKLLMIVTGEKKRVTERILAMKRGVTVINATGGFSGEEKSVILCVTTKNEYYRFRRAIAEVDKNAFIIISNAGEVLGKGFLPL